MAETTKKAQETKVNPWEQMEKVFIPKMSRGEQPTHYVSVNGRGYFVPKGEEVEVPKPVAEVIKNAQAQQKKTEQEAEQNFGGSAVPKR